MLASWYETPISRPAIRRREREDLEEALSDKAVSCSPRNTGSHVLDTLLSKEMNGGGSRFLLLIIIVGPIEPQSCPE
jgi:hypothetical protein